MNKEVSIKDWLNLVNQGKEKPTALQDYDAILLKGFDKWYVSRRNRKYNVNLGVVAVVVSIVACFAVWHLTPPVEAGAIDAASASHRAELIASTKSLLNIV